MKKILTISVAAYNMESFIAECLDSFCKCKNLDSLEVIVNDNGATDGTARIVQTYVDRYPDVFQLVTRESNGHYGAVLNSAIQMATGKYFKLVDGDDWVDAEALDKLIDFLKSTDVDAVINNYQSVYPEYVKINDLIGKYNCNINYTFESLKEFQFYPMHGLTVRLDRYRKYMKPISEHRGYVDNEFVLQVMMAINSFAFLREAVYQHRLGRAGQSVSVNSIYKNLSDVIFEGEKLFSLYASFDRKNWTMAKRRYLSAFMEQEYRWVLGWCTLVPQNNKDYLLKIFLHNIQEQYGEVIKGFHLGIYQILLLNFNMGVWAIRNLKKIKYTYLSNKNNYN